MTRPSYGPKHSFRKSHDELPGAARFLYDGLPLNVQKLVSQSQEIGKQGRSWNNDRGEGWSVQLKRWLPKRPSRTYLALITLWLITLWWGERAVFSQSIGACDWKYWDHWPQEANPHRVVLLADPQLVDPHTYPTRPWPLSTLTIRHTDLYLRRSFLNLLRLLDPDTVFFLGDLFDGGREWAAEGSENEDKRWRKYDKAFWLQEFDRFGRIFLDPWIRRLGKATTRNEHRKIIASLPGNHDLGLGTGIRVPVRQRFNTFFGEGNRIDVIANHTFVSMDTVSLSAKDQPDAGIDGQTTSEDKGQIAEIWSVVEDFLSTAKSRKQTAINQTLKGQFGLPENLQYDHEVLDLSDPAVNKTPAIFSLAVDIPTILLTHVPLYRSPGTPCGPLRERWPPSQIQAGTDKPVKSDEANAIRVAAGHQYQNVLTPAISKELIDKIGNVEYVFSGDDHDYCEVTHYGYTSKGGGIREITVKSMSWAMGVRRPGFLMLSLWNPLDVSGQALNVPGTEQDGASKSPSLQSHLCLLPDQLAIFIRYGLLLALTLLAILVRAIVVLYEKARSSRGSSTGILPFATSFNHFADEKKTDSHREGSHYSSSSSEWSSSDGLAVRASAGRTRSASPANVHGLPMAEIDAAARLGDDSAYASNGNRGQALMMDEPYRERRGGISGVLDEFRWGVFQVASIAILWYAWLVWSVPS